jgi:hypothetical protein
MHRQKHLFDQLSYDICMLIGLNLPDIDSSSSRFGQAEYFFMR